MKKIKPKLKQLIKRRQKDDSDQPSGNLPRITSDTVAEDREEVIKSAKKYIYPLRHSKHKILFVSIAVLVAGFIIFAVYITLALYRFGGTSEFLHRVTQVVPAPVAKAGGQFVSYEDYLFELRHYMHYYESQQELDFNSPEGQQQLAAFKKQALDKVVNDAYIKQLANKYQITVSGEEINEQIRVVRDQNRLGNSEQVLEDVLKDYWGWSIDDFRRTLHSQLLAQKVVATLDTETVQHAQEALDELNAGKKFANVAKKYSDDERTKDEGGELGVVERTNRDISAQTVDALFALKEGEHSGIIQVGYSLEIVKNLEKIDGSKVKGAHILFNFEDVSTYLNDLKNQQDTKFYIKA